MALRRVGLGERSASWWENPDGHALNVGFNLDGRPAHDGLMQPSRDALFRAIKVQFRRLCERDAAERSFQLLPALWIMERIMSMGAGWSLRVHVEQLQECHDEAVLRSIRSIAQVRSSKAVRRFASAVASGGSSRCSRFVHA